MASAISATRDSKASPIFSTKAIRSSAGVSIHAGKAALAAATAASVSACPPSEMTAQGSSVDGSMTWWSAPSAGSRQAPSM